MGIARAFQITNIFPNLTVYESIKLAILSKQNGLNNMWTRFKDHNVNGEANNIMNLAGLTKSKNIISSELSHGDQKLLDIALALCLKPKLLLLDEPTNDLDIETLEALEARLENYTGTLIVVSHDRHFLDRVVTSTLVFEEDGSLKRYGGGYSDWARLKHSLATPDERDEETKVGKAQNIEISKPTKPKKLSYKLQRELNALPKKIAAIEGEIAVKQTAITSPGFYEQPYEAVRDHLHELAVLQRDLDRVIDRWAELEEQLPT